MKTVGITGCTGGFGKRFLELLLKQNYNVKALIRRTSKLDDIKNKNKINFIYGDITDFKTLIEFVEDIEICFHLAALVKNASRKDFYKVNISGTDNICKAVLKYSPGCRFIHCSTISSLKVNPIFKFKNSIYAVSKYYGEKKVIHHIKNNELKGTIIYPGLIYGPYDKTLVPSAVYLLKKNMIKLCRGGESNAPLIYADELYDLFIKAANNDKAIGKRYISVKGSDIGIHEFIKMIADKMNLKMEEKVYNKYLLYLKAFYNEILFKMKIKKDKLFLTKSILNILSINFNNYKKRFDSPEKDLGWAQSTSKEYIDRTLNDVLDSMRKGRDK